jgi:hypothetical protein
MRRWTEPKAIMVMLASDSDQNRDDLCYRLPMRRQSICAVGRTAPPTGTGETGNGPPNLLNGVIAALSVMLWRGTILRHEMPDLASFRRWRVVGACCQQWLELGHKGTKKIDNLGSVRIILMQSRMRRVRSLAVAPTDSVLARATLVLPVRFWQCHVFRNQLPQQVATDTYR